MIFTVIFLIEALVDTSTYFSDPITRLGLPEKIALKLFHYPLILYQNFSAYFEIRDTRCYVLCCV